MANRKVAVIGAGPAGMTASGRLASNGFSVTLFERNSLLGKKLGITGKGRCNVTNDCSEEEFMKAMTSNGKFLYSAISNFSSRDTMEFIESLGVPLKTERGNRVFPASDKATDIVLALKKYVIDSGVRIVCARVKDISQNEDGTLTVSADNGTRQAFDSVILCTGGMSYPLTGSTGDGYAIARKLGHTIMTPIPSLVGLESEDKLCRDCQGLSLKNVGISVKDSTTGKVIYKDFGEMLFTHFGVSGPMILSASAHTRPMENGRYTVYIDLKPALDTKTLDTRVLSDFDKYKNKNLENSLSDLLPSKLIHPFIKQCGLEYDKKVNSITKSERETIVSTLKELPVTIRGFRPIEEAIVTSGGIKTSEIDPRRMESKIVSNLYFAGEIIDIDAYTGGFNLQIAFSTAVTAAEAIINS